MSHCMSGRDDGIFAALLKSSGKNPVEAGLVKVIPSDNVCCNPVANIVTGNWKQHWFSFHPNPFLVFDFSPQKVSVVGYWLRTYSGGEGYAHMKSWVLEGSADGGEFEVIDRVEGCADLNRCDASRVFELSRETRPYDKIRIRMTGPSHAGSDFMVVRGIEFFGKVL